MAIVALEIVAGPGETATIKNAKPVDKSE